MMWRGSFELRSLYVDPDTHLSLPITTKGGRPKPSTRAIPHNAVIAAVMFIVISIFMLIANAMIRAR